MSGLSGPRWRRWAPRGHRAAPRLCPPARRSPPSPLARRPLLPRRLPRAVLLRDPGHPVPVAAHARVFFPRAPYCCHCGPPPVLPHLHGDSLEGLPASGATAWHLPWRGAQQQRFQVPPQPPHPQEGQDAPQTPTPGQEHAGPPAFESIKCDARTGPLNTKDVGFVRLAWGSGLVWPCHAPDLPAPTPLPPDASHRCLGPTRWPLCSPTPIPSAGSQVSFPMGHLGEPPAGVAPSFQVSGAGKPLVKRTALRPCRFSDAVPWTLTLHSGPSPF